jgi:hypothetical protein
MMNESIKQIKLVTGEEVIAKIVEEDDVDVFIRNALTIQFAQTPSGDRMYTFKLFFCYQDDPERLTMLKMDKIVAVANPVQEMIDQYNEACANIFYEDVWSAGKEDFNPFESVRYEEMFGDDSASKNNVVDFKPKLH